MNWQIKTRGAQAFWSKNLHYAQPGGKCVEGEALGTEPITRKGFGEVPFTYVTNPSLDIAPPEAAVPKGALIPIH